MARSGSEKRQLTAIIKARVTPAQKQDFGQQAARAGVSEADLVRNRLFSAKPLRATRHPSVDREEICRLIAVFGQMADRLHALELAGASPLEIEAMQRDVADACGRALEALGRPP